VQSRDAPVLLHNLHKSVISKVKGKKGALRRPHCRSKRIMLKKRNHPTDA